MDLRWKKSIPSAVVIHYCAWYPFYGIDIMTLLQHVNIVKKCENWKKNYIGFTNFNIFASLINQKFFQISLILAKNNIFCNLVKSATNFFLLVYKLSVYPRTILQACNLSLQRQSLSRHYGKLPTYLICYCIFRLGRWFDLL